MNDRLPPRRRLVLAGAGGLVALLLGVLIITIRNKDGKETVVRVPSGVEVDVDAQPGSKVTIREETSPKEQPKSLPDASPMMAKTQEADSSTAEEDSLEVDYDAERRAAQAIAEKMTGGWMILVDSDNQPHKIDSSRRILPKENFFIEDITSIPEIDDQLIAMLALCQYLKTINLTNSKISSLKLLPNWPLLEDLGLTECANQAESFHLMPAFPKLKVLGLRGVDVDVSALKAIANTSPKIKFLDIADGASTGPKDLAPLEHFRMLETLICCGSQLSDENLSTLADLPNLFDIRLLSSAVDPTRRVQKLSSLKDKLRWLEINTWHNADPGLSAEDYSSIVRLDRLEKTEIGRRFRFAYERAVVGNRQASGIKVARGWF